MTTHAHARRAPREPWPGKVATGLVLILALASGIARAIPPERSIWNMTQGVTDISHRVYTMHMIVFAVVTVIGIGVFGTMIYSIINHRRSKHPRAADFHESVLIEIIWTTAPFIVLVGLAIPAAGLLLRMEDTRNAELVVQATGYQWKWQYEYFSADNKPYNVSFFSMLAREHDEARQLGQHRSIDQLPPHYLWEVDNPLVVPVGVKIKFRLTAADVIHAWWVPDLALKKDAIPGYINEVWTKIDKPGHTGGSAPSFAGVTTVSCRSSCAPSRRPSSGVSSSPRAGTSSPNGTGPGGAVNAPLATAAPASDTSLGPAAGAVAGGGTGRLVVPATAVSPAMTIAPPPAGLFPLKVNFAVGKADVTAADAALLARAAAYLKANPTAKIGLTGYTDPTGDPVKNAELRRPRQGRAPDADRRGHHRRAVRHAAAGGDHRLRQCGRSAPG